MQKEKSEKQSVEYRKRRIHPRHTRSIDYVAKAQNISSTLNNDLVENLSFVAHLMAAAQCMLQNVNRC